MALATTARTTSSSLKGIRSSRLPPPRATMITSGRGTRPPLGQPVEAGDGRHDLGRRVVALDRHRPEQHVAREAVGQAVQDVADDGAGGRGDDADHLGQVGQRPLARGVEQAFGGEALAPLLQHLEQRAFAGQLRLVDDDLVLGAAGVAADPAGHHQLHAVLEPQLAGAPTVPRQQTASITAPSSFRLK